MSGFEGDFHPLTDSRRVLVCARNGRQRPGDLNRDRVLDISDVVTLISYLFLENASTLPCEGGPGGLALADFNGDRALDVSDVVAPLQFLFLGGTPHVLGIDCMPIEGCPDLCR